MVYVLLNRLRAGLPIKSSPEIATAVRLLYRHPEVLPCSFAIIFILFFNVGVSVDMLLYMWPVGVHLSAILCTDAVATRNTCPIRRHLRLFPFG